MKNLKKAVETKIKLSLRNQTAKISKMSDADIFDFTRWNCNRNKNYVGTILEQKAKIIGYLKNKTKKEIMKKLADISEIAKAKKPTREFFISVSWKKNKTWGQCPTATDNNGNSSGTITGCGYCKLSTAVAKVLNENLYLLKKMYLIKDKNMRKENHNLFGYGSGYNILPNFEGGVGMPSLENILKKLCKKIIVNSTDDSYSIVIKV
jgi:hypothetical protein